LMEVQRTLLATERAEQMEVSGGEGFSG